MPGPGNYSVGRSTGHFPFTKKFGNFLLGISVWEKRVPFVTSPILGRPGCLIDRDRHGTGDKDNKSVNGTQIFHWEVSTGKTGLPSLEFRLFWKISSGMNEKVVFRLQPDQNFWIFVVNGKHSQCHLVRKFKKKKKKCDVIASNLLFIIAMDSIERVLKVKFFLIHTGHTSLRCLWNTTVMRGKWMKDLHNRVSRYWETLSALAGTSTLDLVFSTP